MRLIWIYILIPLLFSLENFVIARHIGIVPRNNALPSTAAASSTLSSTSNGAAASTSGTAPAETDPTTTSHISPTRTTIAATQSLSANDSAIPTAPTNITAGLSIDDGSLPLQPVVTPALSVAGAFLMLSGVIYAAIGIKNRWIQIFMSTAYLISLAITVLLLYVLVPPISNAVQGAYFVAAFVPAVGLGALALIFKDMVEGAGCAVGGFALAMFFLVLKEGGLLTNTASKAIFIGCWTAGIYALYFSHHLRGYVLIGGTSLGGATAIILGVDCFSLAGLKEFWVYIWALNGKLFPPLQDTYPITHGMRAEIAGIVVLTFFGVLSQLRIWKIIQERRQKKEIENTEEERLRDEMEAELGQAVQAGQEEERKQWERVYDDGTNKKLGSIVTTDVSSDRKGSESFSIKDRETTKVASCSATAKSQRSSIDSRQHGQPVVVQVAEDDITPAMSDETQNASPFWSSGPPSSEATPISLIDHPAKAHTRSDINGPKVIPLPFQIPAELSILDDQEDGGSIAALVDNRESQSAKGISEDTSQAVRSRPPLFRSLSNKFKRVSIRSSTSVEALDDDAASRKARTSFLGTLSFEDQPDDGIALSEIASRISGSDNVSSMLGKGKSSADEIMIRSNSAAEGSQHWPLQSEKRDSLESSGRLRSTSQSTSPHANVKPEEDEMPKEPTRPISDFPRAEDASQSRATSIVSESEKKEHVTEDKPSKVLLQFRTNEWAKHLEAAEKPSPGAIVSYGPMTEEPASLIQTELLKTPLTAAPAPAPLPARDLKTTSSKSPKTKRAPARVPSRTIEDTSGIQRSPAVRASSSSSSLPLNRASPMHSDLSRHSQRLLFPSIRASSSSLLASPIAEDAVASFPPNPSASPRPTRTPRRSGTDPTISSTQTFGQFQQPSRNVSPMSSTPDVTAALSNENLPLSKRKSYLHQNSILNLATDGRRVSSNPVPRTTAYLKNAPQRQQTHPPPDDQQYDIPDHTIQRASMLAEWRRTKALEQSSSNVRNMPSSSGPGGIPNYTTPDQGPIQSARVQSMGQGASWGSYSPLGGTGINVMASRGSKGMVDSAIYGHDRSRRASAMTAKEVDQAHREVLRRMQAGANRALKQDSQGT